MRLVHYGAPGGSCDQGWQNAYNSGLPFGAFFRLYICNYRCHRHLHANFQEDRPEKKPNFFHLKIWCNVSLADCTVLDVLINLQLGLSDLIRDNLYVPHVQVSSLQMTSRLFLYFFCVRPTFFVCKF